MARPTRIEFCGAAYHITARGNRREPNYLEDKDKARFLNILESVILRLNWLLHSYCIMDNHYHLMIETPDGILSNGMRYLNSVYSQWFNRKYRINGHLLQGQYSSKLIDGTDQLLLTARYIVLNPVKAHLIEEPHHGDLLVRSGSFTRRNTCGGSCGESPERQIPDLFPCS